MTYTKENKFSIKKDDTFLMFDLNEDIMNQIEKIKTDCNSIDAKIITKFRNKYKMFHQKSLDSEIKTGQKIINEQLFQEKLNHDHIKNAFIIKIIEVYDEYFIIEASNLKNKLDNLKLLKNIEILNNKIKEFDNDCFKIDYEIIKPQENLIQNLEKYYNKLYDYYNSYNNSFNQIKENNQKAKDKAKQKLQKEIENIKINLSDKHRIQGNLNELKTYEGIGTVLVGNKNLLELIKKKIYKTDNVKTDNCMIFKLYDVGKDENYYYKEYINRYTEYSITNAYLLLGLVLSYFDIKNYK